MKHILHALGFLWLLPTNILFWLFWLLPMKFKGTFEDIWWDWDNWSLNWDVSNTSEFYQRMGYWWGFVLGNNIIYVDYFPKTAIDKRHIKHENTHVLQNYICGILFYPIYYLMSACIFWFGGEDKHFYYDNPFERWARRSAGQEVEIPKSRWLMLNNEWKW